MIPLFPHLLIPFVLAMLLSMTMGGSGIGPSFSVAYGTDVLKKSIIPILFGIMIFLGALLAGKATGNTIGKEIVNPGLMNYKIVSVVFFSVFIALLIANLVGIPQSTSQTTVLSLTAVSLYFGEFNSDKLFYAIIPTWFILPIISFLLCFVIAKFIYTPLRKTGLTISLTKNNVQFFSAIIIAMSLYVAFSIGSNNVANAAGPIAVMTAELLDIDSNQGFPILMLIAILIIAPCFGIGSAIFGEKILNNTGKEIVLFGKFEAIIIAFVSGSLLLAASLIQGIPTSLVQLNVGAILGIGVCKMGFKNIFKKTQVNKFFLIWLIAPVISFFTTYLSLLAIDYFDFL